MRTFPIKGSNQLDFYFGVEKKIISELSDQMSTLMIG